MDKKAIEELKQILDFVCLEIGERLTGSINNRRLQDYTKSYFIEKGYDVEMQKFSCLGWNTDGAMLSCNGNKINARPSYYTEGCSVEAEYIKIASISELENSNLQGKIAVLHDKLTVEQLMPKGFMFYNPDHHQRIINLLEEKNPLAIVAVVDNNTSIFEDGDFDIPSVYVSRDEGEKILKNNGMIKLSIKTERKKSTGANVIARINKDKDRKVVITAHLDTKYGTPGALDNGTGVAILLLLSKLIKSNMIDYCLELLLLNGEDYYSIPGQVKYMHEYLTDNEDIMLAINCDGIGLKGSITALSLMELPDKIKVFIQQLLTERSSIELIDPWVEGDHMLFRMRHIPAVALTSRDIFEIIDNIVHTEKDNLEIVDYNMVLEVVNFLEKLVLDFPAA